MEYDALGQLVSEQTEAFGSTTQLRHAYDELGNRVQTVLPDGRVLNNLYYGSGHLHQINLDGEVITDIERDRTHRMISRTQGALTSQFEYDPVGRLVSQMAGKLEVGQSVEPLIARKYEYDQAGNLVSIDDKRNGVTRYSYDVIGRILSAVQPNLEERFAFDPAHNIMDATTAKVGRVEGNRVRVFEDKRYDYDAHGNVIEKLIGKHTKMRFEWNAAHQMVKSVVARNSSDAVQTVRYFYDPFGRRIGKRDAFGTTRFVWDGNRLLCEERGSHRRTHVYGTDPFVPVAQIEAVSQARQERNVAEIRHLHTDHLGTPRELTDRAGNIVWAAQYQAWGNVLRAVAPLTDVEVSADSELRAAQPIRFQGQYYDPETGLHYNRFRYFDLDIGRFISHDPIGLQGGFNTYQYAANPLSWIDPVGLAGTKIVVIGEGQRGVDEAAKLLRAHGHDAESMMFPKMQWRAGRLDENTTPAEFERMVQWNKKWLMDKIASGYQVVDIGPDGREIPSRFYEAELEAIKETGHRKIVLKKFESGEAVSEMRRRLCK